MTTTHTARALAAKMICSNNLTGDQRLEHWSDGLVEWIETNGDPVGEDDDGYSDLLDTLYGYSSLSE